ncbi:MAG TPA: hypothetical protein VGN88_04585, partial [Phycisphaerae bacterium]
MADPYSYRCAQVLPIVNRLRRLGKDETLDVLSRYYRSDKSDATTDRDANVLILSRLLFLSPKEGWPDNPLFVIDSLSYRIVTKKRILDWPIAVSDNVPFLLVARNDIGGSMQGVGEQCIEICKCLQLRKVDWPTAGFQAAAEELCRGELLQRLNVFPTEAAEMEDRIRAQSGIADKIPLDSVGEVYGQTFNADRLKRGLPSLPSNWVTGKDCGHYALWRNPALSLSSHARSHAFKGLIANESGRPLKEFDMYQSGRTYVSKFNDPGESLWESLCIIYDFGAAARGDSPWSCEINCGPH